VRTSSLPFDSNVFVQESRQGWLERACNGERSLVILSAARDLAQWAPRSFAALRMTLGGRFVSPRLMSRCCNRLESMVHSFTCTWSPIWDATDIAFQGNRLSSFIAQYPCEQSVPMPAPALPQQRPALSAYFPRIVHATTACHNSRKLTAFAPLPASSTLDQQR